jgi:predicted secreted protein
MLAASLLALGGLAACGDDSSSGSSSSTTSPSTSSTVPAGGGAVVTEPGPVEVGVGQQVTLELESNPTTGYSWELTSAPDTAVVRIVWETDVPPSETASFDVTVA